MELLRTTDNLQLVPALNLCRERCLCCRNSRELTLDIVRFNSKDNCINDYGTPLTIILEYESVRFWASDCNPAAIQLIRSGLFPCAPKYPTLTVGIHMLDFVTRLFLRISPNHTAWCGTLEDYLRSQSYKLQGQDPLRRRFGNALHWFNSLQAATEEYVSGLLLQPREEFIRAHHSVESTSDTEPRQEGSRWRGVTVEEVEDEDSPRRSQDVGHSEIDVEYTDVNVTETLTRKRSHDREEEESEPQRPGIPQRPSEYLRRRCPICFGGDFDREKDRLNWTDIIVCLDTCFTQRHNSQPHDPPRAHPDSFFIPKNDVDAVEERVDAAREATSRPVKRAKVDEEDDRLEPGMMLSKGVLDLCGGSFKAAHEFLAKVIPKGSDVTGLMALLCRHDRPLWVVNMTTPGERQHYAIALLERLFAHLPPYLTVGCLYDIGCQLERSCLKWGLLEEHLDNLVFAISVFHAFGHQWACQIIYHPRKCERFGLSDGEGAERLWHAIQHLIAYTRIAGYHLRMYTLDAQFHSLNNENLLKMGSWIQRKERLLEIRRVENQRELAETGKTVALLREQWQDQVSTQTRPLLSQSKNKGKNTVLECMRLRRAQKALAGRLKQLQDTIGNPEAAEYEVAAAEVDLPEVTENYEKKTETLRKKERALGVTEKSQLHHLTKSPFISKSMNARAIMMRLRERLRARKFELERLERSYRKQRSDQRLDEHTENSVKRRDPGIQELARKYNQLVREMRQLIILRRAPRNAVAPELIDTLTLFNLDVDDAIWQDMGLNYDEQEENSVPPPWLADEKVRKGIRAMLELDRCEEEHERLKVEQQAMQTWFVEEWEVLKVAIDVTGELLIFTVHNMVI
ncbi:hypothetical protein K435DRAFT_659654 [Dendrothele bispora CBS 962.96]|uniref:CxC1-like cysteine cluster associated with KDZ transposases domain-containing protein n=1 Tax=Dendrothele bispora (strain CBS 962.96) TaxID=1314807 RepID=A0A4S8MAW8_DENBC|nr:hypothetical protein K435DRAFT_659654 [Dendrothele bispora CBS 962.96]